MEEVVLVGFDGSPTSRQALDWALAEAKNRGWPVQLVSAFTPAPVDDPMVSERYADAAAHGGHTLLQEALDRAKAGNVPAESRVVAGDPSEILVDLSHDAGLAVVGKRGRGGFTGRLLGSVSSALAAHAACPTVVVPQNWTAGGGRDGGTPDNGRVKARRPETGYLPWLVSSPPGMRGNKGLHPDDKDSSWNYGGQVVVGIDALGVNNPAVWAAASAAQAHGRPLRLVSTRAPFYRDSIWLDHGENADRFREDVAGELDPVLAELRERYPELDVSWNFYIGKPAEILVHITRTAELMVLGTRGHGGFPGLLLGSVSQAVLHHGSCPMMVVPKETA